MQSRDPFQRLNLKSAGNILQHLGARTIVRCQRVSTGWHDFIHAWIESSGFSSHFPGQSNQDTTRDPVSLVQRFKELAATEHNLISGKPTCVRRIEAFEGLVVAGDIAAWLTGDDGEMWEEYFYWQRLGFKEDGSVFAAQRMRFEQPHEGWNSLLLNSDGYALFVRWDYMTRSRILCVALYFLPEGRKLYTKRWGDLGRSSLCTPRLMSRRRIYFASLDRLRGYDLLSGEQIYMVRFEDKAPQAGRSPPPPMRDFYLLHDGQSELVLITQRHYKSVTFTILNGDDGNILQQLVTECWPNPQVLVPRSRMEFVVVSHKGLLELHYKMQTFSRSRDGLFTERTIDTFTLDFRLTDSYLVAVNPVWNVVAYYLKQQSIPAVSRLSSDNAPPNSRAHSTDRPQAEPVGGRLHHSTPQQLTLPPRYSHNKTRRPYVLESRFYYPRDMQFVNGDRLLFVTMPHKSGGPGAYYVFDFRPRPRWGLLGDLVRTFSSFFNSNSPGEESLSTEE